MAGKSNPTGRGTGHPSGDPDGINAPNAGDAGVWYRCGTEFGAVTGCWRTITRRLANFARGVRSKLGETDEPPSSCALLVPRWLSMRVLDQGHTSRPPFPEKLCVFQRTRLGRFS